MFNYHFSVSPHQTQPRPSTWILMSVKLVSGTGGPFSQSRQLLSWGCVLLLLMSPTACLLCCCWMLFVLFLLLSYDRGVYPGWTEVMCLSWSCRPWPPHTCTTEAGSLITLSSPWLSCEYHQCSWKRICESSFVWCSQWCQMSYMSHTWPLAFCLNFSGLYNPLPCSM